MSMSVGVTLAWAEEPALIWLTDTPAPVYQAMQAPSVNKVSFIYHKWIAPNRDDTKWIPLV